MNIFSLWSKLTGAFVLIVFVALVLAASVFVIVRRGEQEEQELDHVIAASPAIYGGLSILQERNAGLDVLVEFVHVAADSFDVRVLLVTRDAGIVEADSAGSLVGEQLQVPEEVNVAREGRIRPYVSWEPPSGSPGSDLILVAAGSGRFAGSPAFEPARGERHTLLLAVPESTIARAWRGLLPALLLAAAIAVPVAVVLATVVARYITHPLQQLTVASQRMAEGDFDVAVSIDRRDEVGRLAQTFSGMAERVGEAHGQMRALVANVSHDLKTPLTSILGFAQALRDRGAPNDDEARRMGAVIHDEAARMTARLNDLLYLSELESGQALLQRDEVDLRRLVEGAIGRLRPALDERKLRLETELAEVTVSADGPKLERAVENLLDNARKYAPEGSAVRVRLAAGGDGAVIEIANQSALAAGELPRRLERFYRGDRTRRGATGSGLGLPIARDLVELHGGELTASLAGGEIVFSVRLPQA